MSASTTTTTTSSASSSSSSATAASAITTTPAATTTRSQSDPPQLKSLEKVLSTFIQDCIRLTDWQNLDQAEKHKNYLFTRLITSIQKVFSRLGVNTTSINGITQAQSDNGKTNINQAEGNFNRDNQDISLRNSNQNYSRGPNSNQMQQSPRSDDEYQGESESEFFEGDSSENEYHRHRRSSRHKPYKYQQRNGGNGYIEKPRRGGLGIPGLSQSASINSYPMDEKKRVLEFYNERYDPAKRNKIELIELMVKQFGYSKSSLYYLVTNQKMFEAVQRQLEMAQSGQNYHQQNNYPIYSTHQQGGYYNSSSKSSSNNYGTSNQYGREDRQRSIKQEESDRHFQGSRKNYNYPNKENAEGFEENGYSSIPPNMKMDIEQTTKDPQPQHQIMGDKPLGLKSEHQESLGLQKQEQK